MVYFWSAVVLTMGRRDQNWVKDTPWDAGLQPTKFQLNPFTHSHA